MKTKLITLSAFIFVLVSFAHAQIPNPGFENWYNSPNGFDPVGWGTSNANPFVSVMQATPGYQGNYAVKVKTWETGIFVVPGTCQSDAFNFSSRPTTLSGFVKCTVIPGDSVSITITVTNGGIAGTAVGAARKVFSASIPAFTSFDLPIDYGSSSATDTIYIDIIAGSLQPSLGTEIIVDALSLTPATGIGKIKDPFLAMIGQNYPNPVKDHTVIPVNLMNTGNINIKLFDLLGRELRTVFNEAMTAGEHQVRISVADLPDGIYFYTVQGDNFTVTRKFTVSK